MAKHYNNSNHPVPIPAPRIRPSTRVVDNSQSQKFYSSNGTANSSLFDNHPIIVRQLPRVNLPRDTTNSLRNEQMNRLSSYQERQKTETFFKETYVEDGQDDIVELQQTTLEETYEKKEIMKRISDEFRFLEERNTIRQRESQEQQPFSHKMSRRSMNSWNRTNYVLSYRKYLVVSASVLQLLVSVGLFAFAVTRYKRNFEIPMNNQSTQANLLFDFTKAEDYANSNQEGTAIVAIKLGQSIFIPAILQLLAGVVGLFPLDRRPPKFYMILHLLFSSFAIVLWMEPIFLAALELNLRNVQLNNFYDGINFRVLLAVALIVSIDILLIGSCLAIYSAAQLASDARTKNSVVDMHINMCTLLISLACVALACYATGNSMTQVASWPASTRNIAALYGFGLRELVVCSYVLCSAIFGTLTTIFRQKSLRMGAIVTQSISLFSVCLYLLNADRMTATTHNVQVMLRASVVTPFSGEIVIILYSFIVLLAIVMLIQLTSTIINVFQFPPVETYATPITLPFGSAGGERMQRSAL